jgi:hypothetical protein
MIYRIYPKKDATIYEDTSRRMNLISIEEVYQVLTLMLLILMGI